jgi:long-chain fatty acid transport protein
MGQGGAFAARASDPSAIFFNPAGISYLKGLNIMAGTTLVLPKSSFRGPSNFNTNQETKMNNLVFLPSNAYVTYSLENGLGLGLGFFTPYGLGSEWPDNWVGKALTTKTTLQTFYFNPTVSYRFGDCSGFNGSVGVGFDYVLSTVLLKRRIPNFDPEPTITLETNKAGTGYGFTAGLLLKPIQDVSVGVSYRSKTKIDFDGKATFDGGSPAVQQLLPGGDASTSITMPSILFAGVAVRAMKDLEVEADIQLTGWSSYDKLEIDFAQETSAQEDQEFAKNYKDVFMIRLGAEYTMDNLQLRAGYIFDKNPVPDETLDPMLPDADRNDITLGVGYKLTENWMVDLSYMLVLFKQRTQDPGVSINGFDGTYNSTAHLFALDISYHF